MEIELTRAQWESLKPLVSAAARAQRTLGVPLEIDNGDQKIEIDEAEVKITLES